MPAALTQKDIVEQLAAEQAAQLSGDGVVRVTVLEDALAVQETR